MLIDITKPIHPRMAIYPGNPEVIFERVSDASPTSSALTKITLGSHTGTHIDAPSHIKVGGVGTDTYVLDRFVGTAQVIDLSFVESVVSASDLLSTQAPRVLIRTRNSSGSIEKFDSDFVALHESAAQELVKRGVELIGIDAPSIKKKGVKDKTHEILLDAGVIILEGLWMPQVAAGNYELLCLPLSLKNLDGAPGRVVLRQVDT
jgi:arylformamidase